MDTGISPPVKHFGTIDGRGKYTSSHGSSRQQWTLLPRKDGEPRLKRIVPEQRKRKKRDATMRVGAGGVELVKRGASRYDFSDPYHIAIELSWKEFAFAFAGLELGINVVFALLYLASPGCVANMRPGSFSDAFFFSLETLATVGYGAMAPATLYGHAVSAIEIVCGMVFTAIMTGLLFVRFSKPRPRILYADQAVVTSHNCSPTLMVRIANGRMTLLTHAMMRLGRAVARGKRGRPFAAPLARPRSVERESLFVRADLDRDARHRRKKSARRLRRRAAHGVRCAPISEHRGT
jgi:Ion channel